MAADDHLAGAGTLASGACDEELLEQLIAGSRQGARARLAMLAGEGSDYLSIAVDLLQPALYRVGELWQAGRISVAQEHLASALAHVLLLEAYQEAEAAPPNGKRALFACVQGNHHALGLRMVADGFELLGFETHYLGADVPHDDLIAYATSVKPDLIGLSVSMGDQLSQTQRTIKALRHAFGSSCPSILVGGLPLLDDAARWRSLGADDAYPDARKALASTS